MEIENLANPTNKPSFDENPNDLQFKKPVKIVKDLIIDLSFLDSFPSIDLVDDGGVKKIIIKEGKFLTKISNNSTTKIKYEGRKVNGELIDQYRDRNQPRNIKLGNYEMIPGIEICLKTMNKGEICWLKLEPKYHYYSNITKIVNEQAIVKSDDILLYKIELLDYENPFVNLSANEDDYLNCLKEHQIRGNDYFKEGDFVKARKQYVKAANILNTMPKQLKETLSIDYQKAFNEFRGIFNSNAAAAYLKEGNKQLALEFAQNAVKATPSNDKFLFRLACCRMENQQFKEASLLFSELKTRDPKNPEIQSKLIELESRFSKKHSEETLMWKKAFEKLPNEIENEKRLKIMEKKRQEKQEEDMNSKEDLNNQIKNPLTKNTLEELQKGSFLNEKEIMNLLNPVSDSN